MTTYILIGIAIGLTFVIGFDLLTPQETNKKRRNEIINLLIERLKNKKPSSICIELSLLLKEGVTEEEYKKFRKYIERKAVFTDDSLLRKLFTSKALRAETTRKNNSNKFWWNMEDKKSRIEFLKQIKK